MEDRTGRQKKNEETELEQERSYRNKYFRPAFEFEFYFKISYVYLPALQL